MLLCMICEMFLLLIRSSHTITTVVSCYCFSRVKTQCFVLFYLYVLNFHITVMPLHNLEKAPRQYWTLVCLTVNFFYLYILNFHIFIMPLHNLEKAPRQCRTLVCQIVNYYNTYSYTLNYISALLQLNVEYILVYIFCFF